MKTGSKRSTALIRAACLFGVWIVLDQSAKAADLVVGAMVTIGATWLSLRLLPPQAGQVRLIALILLVPRFLRQSLSAGVDVARRALDPRLPLHPGLVNYPVRLPRGPARNAFAMISSLLPGTVPAGEDDTSLEYHCLDVREPVVEQLAAEERAYGKALLPGRGHA